MTRPFRSLQSSSNSPLPEATVDSDFVVVLASLLCALICVLGLIAVARCAWLRRLSSRSPSPRPPPPQNLAANKGIKKKILKSLPRETFTSNLSPKFADCAICLTEFRFGDEIRVLPQCGHGFHLSCIDTWLASHSSCPSCRQILVVARCHKCGGLPSHANSPSITPNAPDTSVSSSTLSAAGEPGVRLKEPEHDDANRFLP